MEDKRNISVLIVDDDAVAMAQSLENISLYVEEKRIHRAANAIEMMRVLSSVPIDLAFLDIELKETDGFRIAEYLTQVQPRAKYVFLTGHTELGARSYDYEPIDFLCKPVNALRLRKTFERFDRAHAPQATREQIAVETNAGYQLISPGAIRYVSRDSRKTVIYCQGQEYAVKSTLEELEAMLAEYGVIRCHQSYLLAMSHVVSAEKAAFGRTYCAEMDDGERVPVSRNHYVEVCEFLTRRGLIR